MVLLVLFVAACGSSKPAAPAGPPPASREVMLPDLARMDPPVQAQVKQRYATLGFEQNANIDEGVMWATSFGLTKIDKSNEKQIAELINKAVSD